MGEEIQILEENQTDSGWEFFVRIGHNDFNVRVDREYWQELTSGKENAASLVRRSFVFLLAREPVSSILGEFDLRVIERYFPEYPVEIRL